MKKQFASGHFKYKVCLPAQPRGQVFLLVFFDRSKFVAATAAVAVARNNLIDCFYREYLRGTK